MKPTTKKKAKSGMSDAARADWRASKTADLGRANALKKLAATPDAKAKKPARAFPAPADAPTEAATTPTEAATTAPAPEVAPATPDAPIHEGTAYRPDGAAVTVTVPRDQPETPTAPTGDSNAAPAAGQEQNDGKPDKPKRTRKAPGERKPREGGCLNIAAKLLAEATEPMTTKAMIDQMAAKGLWTSPGGKTPAATLYAAIIREISGKGDAARFRKMDRGLFSAPTAAKEG